MDEEEAVTAEPGESAAGSNGAPRAARGPRSGGSRPGGGAGSPGAVTSSSTPGAAATGTLASDEALAALREKLSGGQNKTQLVTERGTRHAGAAFAFAPDAGPGW